MPFIRGRYYANPIVGAALEAAREAEDAAVSQQDDARDQGEEPDAEGDSDSDSKPVRRIEIDLAELVPAHQGKGTSSYIATLHRESAGGPDGDASNSAAVEKRVFHDPGQVVNFLRETLAKNGICR